MNFPVLSVIVFTPMAAAVLILMIPADRKNEVRGHCAGGGGLCAVPFGLGLLPVPDPAHDRLSIHRASINWLPALGISLHFVGVDGISAPLVLLTGVVMFTGVLISWGDDEHVSRHPGSAA